MPPLKNSGLLPEGAVHSLGGLSHINDDQGSPSGEILYLVDSNLWQADIKANPHRLLVSWYAISTIPVISRGIHVFLDAGEWSGGWPRHLGSQ